MEIIHITLKEFVILKKIYETNKREYHTISELARDIEEEQTNPNFRNIFRILKDEDIINIIDEKINSYTYFAIDKRKLERFVQRTGVFDLVIEFIQNMGIASKLGLRI